MHPRPPKEHAIGRYVLCGELAAGGMATVHLGRLFGQAGFSRTVAIKRLHPQFAKDRDFAAMFVDEARLAARISHPNVVSTLDVEALGDELFLVMEYVAGESLSRLVRTLAAKGERFPLDVLSSILCGALLGLHAAHEATAEDGTPLGIVHRDVSPQNIMVGIDGTARVLDFGVAKAAHRAQITRDGQIKGKVAYMPPEQIQSQPIDRRVDVYGAAVVLWELLAMQRLFDGEHDAAVLMKVMTAEVPPPSALVPGVPPALDAVVMRGLARDVNHRFATTHAMATALEEAIVPASPRKVGEWLSRVAGSTLEKRAQKVKEVESQRGPAPVETAPTPPPGLPPAPIAAEGISSPNTASAAFNLPSQISTIAVTSSKSSTSRRMAPWAAAIGGTAAVLVALVWWLFGRPPQATQPVTAATNEVAPAPETASSAPEPEESAPQTPAASASAEIQTGSPAPPATAQPSAEPAPTPSASAQKAPVRAPSTTKQSAPAKAPSAGCNPPYTVDARGIRHLKPECL